MSDTIKILLAEDQMLVRDALAQLLDMQPNIEVVAVVEDGLQAKQRLASVEVNVVLTDIEMPNCDGLTLCQWVTQNLPNTKTLILTTYNRAGYLKRAVQAGAKGFVLKEVGVEQLVKNIGLVHQGQSCFDAELVLAGLSEQDPLTAREKDALRLSEEGLSTSAMAKKMCLSQGTVRNYLSEAMSKLYATSRVEAAKIAREKGWL